MRHLLTFTILTILLPIYGQEKSTQTTPNEKHAANPAQPQPQRQPIPITVQCNVINQEAPKTQENGSKAHTNSYLSRLFSPENLPNIGLLVAGIAAIIVAICTLGIIKRQTEATEKAAKAAKNSADALINSERAWVMADLRWKDRVRIISIGTDKTKADLELICQNDGRTPAWITEIRARLEIVDSVSPVPIFDAARHGDFLEFRPIPLTVSGKYVVMVAIHCDGMQQLAKSMIVYGFVKYRDIFSPDRETRFGYMFDPSNQLERIISSEYNKAT